MALKLCYCLVLVISSLVSASGSDESDSLSSLVMRHGDRTPVATYPSDPNKAYYLKSGLGQLTDAGKKAQFQLGQWLRKRYTNFFTDTYDEDRIHILSSNLSRTINSVRITLKGVFTNDSNQTNYFDENIVKMDILPIKQDNLVRNNMSCSKIDNIGDNILKTQSYFANINPRLYEYLTNKTNAPVKSLYDAFLVYDLFKTELNHNLTLPEWSKDVFPHPLTEYGMSFFMLQTYTKEIARLKIGPLWNTIEQFFNSSISNPYGSPKILFVSGHEFNIVSLLNSVGAFKGKLPSASACLVFELRRKTESNITYYYVQTYFKNLAEVTKVNIGNCTFKCSLQDFSAELEPLIITLEQWMDECYPSSSWMVVYIIAGVAVVCIFLCMIICCCNRKSPEKSFKCASYRKCPQKFDNKNLI